MDEFKCSCGCKSFYGTQDGKLHMCFECHKIYDCTGKEVADAKRDDDVKQIHIVGGLDVQATEY